MCQLLNSMNKAWLVFYTFQTQHVVSFKESATHDGDSEGRRGYKMQRMPRRMSAVSLHTTL